MYSTTRARSSRKSRKPINIHQNKWPKGYISVTANSRRSTDSFSDLTNMEIVQDSIPRPRPSTVAYGIQPTNTIIGRGKYRYNGVRYEIFMMNVAGVGKVYTRTDGGAFTLIGGTYTTTVWTRFTQSKDRVYIFNGVDKLSYLNLPTSALVTYSALTTPGAPSVAKTALGATTFTYYYRVAANNAVGTSIASTATSIGVSKERTAWGGLAATTPEYVTVTWSAVSGATSYNVYVGDTAGNELLLSTVGNVLSFIDEGNLVADPFTLYPQGNSSDGPTLVDLYNDSRNSQLFGIDNNNKLWYSAPGTGDFSPYNGGGYAPINESGDSTLNYVNGFRDGKGNPVITVGARGSAGNGEMFHVTFESLTYGDQVIVYANVYEANGQSAPYAPRAVVKERDALWYPTGTDIKSTGTSQNIVNILTTNSVSQVIQPDMETVSLAYLDKAVGVAYQDKIFFALPVNSTTNNQIWYIDLARKNLWVLRWTFTGEIKDMWLYEDSSGITHFCILIANRILEFTRAVATEDDGAAFSTRCAFSSLVWDEDGLVMANIRKQYYKFLTPKGDINIAVYGLDKNGVTGSIGNEVYTQTVSFTGYDSFIYDYFEYDDDVGDIQSYAKSIGSQKVKTNAKMINQLDWEITTSTIGCDYLLSAVNTVGETNEKRKLGD